MVAAAHPVPVAPAPVRAFDKFHFRGMELSDGESMLLTTSNLTHYLVSRGLISPESVVAGDYLVIDAGRRNRNFKVLRREDPGLFVKQVRSNDPGAVATLQREAVFYERVRGHSALASLRSLIPGLVDHDPALCSLIVELVANAENLTEYHFRNEGFPEIVGELIGRGLGRYHARPETLWSDGGHNPVLPRQAPWILTLDPATLSPLPGLGEVGQQMSQLLAQRPDILQHLFALRYEWRFDSLVHGDLKWDNLMVSGEGDEQTLHIVDWELVDIGDAAWDAGAILATYLVHYLLSMATPSGEKAAEEISAENQTRLRSMGPALRAFWRSYAAERGLQGVAERRYLERCLRFCGARLVLTTFEFLFNWKQVNAQALGILETGRNILLDPAKAADELLGEP